MRQCVSRPLPVGKLLIKLQVGVAADLHHLRPIGKILAIWVLARLNKQLFVPRRTSKFAIRATSCGLAVVHIGMLNSFAERLAGCACFCRSSFPAARPTCDSRGLSRHSVRLVR